MEKPTQQIYPELQQAYDFFNNALFEGKLPQCLITVQRKSGSYGYFAAKRWENRHGLMTDEIAMNPRHFAARNIGQTLSTLVHEMVHLWQQHFGKPGRGRYHNRQWADKMESLGLCSSSTGQPGGNRTGDIMSHYIVEGGAFERACKMFLAQGFTLSWVDRATEESRKPNTSNRSKYTCPACGLNAWAKPGISLICGACHVEMASECSSHSDGDEQATTVTLTA